MRKIRPSILVLSLHHYCLSFRGRDREEEGTGGASAEMAFFVSFHLFLNLSKEVIYYQENECSVRCITTPLSETVSDFGVIVSGEREGGGGW